MENFYYHVTVIIAVAAIVSPIITALIKAVYDVYIKRLELQHSLYNQSVLHQREIFEGYLKCIGKYLNSRRYDDQALYGTYYALAYMYVSAETKPLLSTMNQYVNSNNFDFLKASETAEKIAVMMKEYLTQLERKYKFPKRIIRK